MSATDTSQARKLTCRGRVAEYENFDNQGIYEKAAPFRLWQLRISPITITHHGILSCHCHPNKRMIGYSLFIVADT